MIKDDATIFRETLDAQQADAKTHYDALQAKYDLLETQYKATQLALVQERRKVSRMAERQKVIARWVRDLRTMLTWEHVDG